MIKILHTADVHLDSPLRSLALRDAELREKVQTSSRSAEPIQFQNPPRPQATLRLENGYRGRRPNQIYRKESNYSGQVCVCVFTNRERDTSSEKWGHPRPSLVQKSISGKSGGSEG